MEQVAFQDALSINGALKISLVRKELIDAITTSVQEVVKTCERELIENILGNGLVTFTFHIEDLSKGEDSEDLESDSDDQEVLIVDNNEASYVKASQLSPPLSEKLGLTKKEPPPKKTIQRQ